MVSCHYASFLAALFDVGVPAISKHLANIFETEELNEEATISKMETKNIYDSGELKEEATSEKISVVRREGNRDVSRNLLFYSLDAIIAVCYRVNSIRATQFRQWA